MNQEIIIPLKKSKLLFAVCATTLFALLNFFIVFATIYRNENSNQFLIVISSIGFLIFGSLSFIGLKRILSKKYNLIVNEIGILDNLSEFSFGLIRWDEMLSIKIEEIAATNRPTAKVLMITTKNPKKHLEEANILRNFLLKLNQKKYGTPVLINISNLDYDLDSFDSFIQTKLENH